MWFFFFSSRRRHTRWPRDWSSDVCSSDLSDPRIRVGAPSQSAREGAARRVIGRILVSVEELERELEIVGPLGHESAQQPGPFFVRSAIRERLGQHGGIDLLKTERLVQLADLRSRVDASEHGAVYDFGGLAAGLHGSPELDAISDRRDELDREDQDRRALAPCRRLAAAKDAVVEERHRA